MGDNYYYVQIDEMTYGVYSSATGDRAGISIEGEDGAYHFFPEGETLSRLRGSRDRKGRTSRRKRRAGRRGYSCLEFERIGERLGRSDEPSGVVIHITE